MARLLPWILGRARTGETSRRRRDTDQPSGLLPLASRLVEGFGWSCRTPQTARTAPHEDVAVGKTMRLSAVVTATLEFRATRSYLQETVGLSHAERPRPCRCSTRQWRADRYGSSCAVAHATFAPGGRREVATRAVSWNDLAR